MGVTAEIAGLACSIRADDLPERALETITASILDGIGCILLGCSDPPVDALLASGVARIGRSGCAVLGRDVRASTLDAALLNGTACRSQDFDDLCPSTLAHPTAAILPAALAACEERGGSGKDLIAAYAAGFETEVLAGLLAGRAHHERGWDATSTLGALGAAGAASRAYGADLETGARALGLAASFAGGLRADSATMAKPVRAGWAARSGLAAAKLALAGTTSRHDQLEAEGGFSVLFGVGRRELPAGVRPGDPLWIERAGIALKAYPCSAGTQAAIDAAIEIRSSTEGFRHQDVCEVVCLVDPIVPAMLVGIDPASPAEARLSMPFCVATALVEGGVSLDSFRPKRLRDTAIRRVMPLVRMDPDRDIRKRLARSELPGDAGGFEGPLPAIVRVRLRDGRWIERTAAVPRGDPMHPLTTDERHGKFRMMASSTYPAEVLDEVIATVENLRDEKTLVRLLHLVGS